MVAACSSPGFTSAAIRRELLGRGWTRRDLAERTGMTPGSVTNVICGNIHSSVARRKVELVLGIAFWTDPAVFAARRPLVTFFGGDPALMELVELDPLARKHLPAAALPIRPRAALRRRLEEHFDSLHQPAPAPALA